MKDLHDQFHNQVNLLQINTELKKVTREELWYFWLKQHAYFGLITEEILCILLQ